MPVFLLPAGKETRSPCQALVRNRLGFRGVLTQTQAGSLLSGKGFGRAEMSQQMGVTGKPERWAASWGGTRGKGCGEGQAGIHPGRSVRAVGSQQEGREEAQGLPQCCVQHFRETQPLS